MRGRVRNKWQRKNSCRAFSLIEVVVALGIVATAVITLVALLPGGLSTFAQARTDTVQRAILDQVKNDLQNSSFTNLFTENSSLPETTYFSGYTHQFDTDGLDYTEGNTTNPPVYTVTLSTNNFVLPGGTSVVNASGYPFAAVVNINIAFQSKTNVYSMLLVNKGY